MNENETQFLLELRQLTMQYGISIEGCGCCGSPSLEKADVSDDRSGYSYVDQLQWIAPSDEYGWRMRAEDIIK